MTTTTSRLASGTTTTEPGAFSTAAAVTRYVKAQLKGQSGIIRCRTRWVGASNCWQTFIDTERVEQVAQFLRGHFAGCKVSPAPGVRFISLSIPSGWTPAGRNATDTAADTAAETQPAPTTADRLRVLANWLNQHGDPAVLTVSVRDEQDEILLDDEADTGSTIGAVLRVADLVPGDLTVSTNAAGSVCVELTTHIGDRPLRVRGWALAGERDNRVIRKAVQLGLSTPRIPVTADLLRSLAASNQAAPLTGPLTADQLATARTDAAQTVAEIKSEIRAEDDAANDPLVALFQKDHATEVTR